MSNNQDKSEKKGLLPFLFGAAAGAAAVFFSKKENRDKTKEAVDTTVKKAKKLKKDIEQNPDKVMKEAKETAEKVIETARKKAKKA